VIHVTVGKHRRIRRADGDQYEIHYEDLAPAQITWWEEVPVVTLATAIMQCISSGTPLYLLRQAITNGHTQGRLTERERTALTELLELGRG
jgi:predicted transcriptional regulator of viral defense system